MRMLKVLLLISAVLTVLLLCGLWDSADIDDLAIYASEGYDLSEDGLHVTLVGISSFFSKNGGDSPLLLVSSGDHMGDARAEHSLRLPNELLYGALQSVVFGRALAEKGVAEYIDANCRSPQTRLNTCLCVAEDTAEALYAAGEKSGRDVGDLLADLLADSQKNSFIPRATVQDFAVTLYNPDRGDPVLPILDAAEDGTLRISGVALFRGDQAVASLRGEDATLLALLRGNRCEGNIPFSVRYADGETDHGTIHVRNARSVRVEKRAEGLFIDLSVRLVGTLAEHASPLPLQEESDRRTELCRRISEGLARDCEALAGRILREYSCDALDLSRYLKPALRDALPTDREQFCAHLAKAALSVTVTLSLCNTGEMS